MRDNPLFWGSQPAGARSAPSVTVDYPVASLPDFTITMTKETNANSVELLKRSEEIRKQAEMLKKKEAPEVLARIKDAIAHYAFTAADLGLVDTSTTPGTTRGRKASTSKPRKAAKGLANSSKPVSRAKFRDAAGNAWSGMGRKPKWFVAALAAGATLDSLKA